MLLKRIVAACCIALLLAGCGSDPTKGDSGTSPPAASQTSGAGPADGGTSPDTGQSGPSGGGGDFESLGNVDPRVVLGIIVVVVVVIAAVEVYHLASDTLDYIRHHTQPASPAATEGGIYRDPRGLFSVAIPVEYPSQTADEVRQTADKNQEQVFFITPKDDDAVYGVSIQALTSASDKALPLADFATKVYPPPTSGNSAAQKPLPTLLEENITLDGKPALFREYSPVSRPDGKRPIYYLLYFLRDGTHSVVLSITWPWDCRACNAGPEASIRSTDSELKKFVESFHLGAQPIAAPGIATRSGIPGNTSGAY